jgi:predicted Zn finger-like uncharacterized protein
LYTQCPECATVFRITADALRAAQGTVRCGICSSSFNAIEYLNEQPIPRQGGEPPFEDTITVEEVHGTEFIELSGADRQEQEDETRSTPVEAGEQLDEVQDADLEFHGSAQDLERLFVTVDPRPVWPATASAATTDEAAPADMDEELEQAILRIAENEFEGIEVLEQRIPEGFEPTDTHPGRIAAVLAFPPRGDHEAGSAGDEPAAGTDNAPDLPEAAPEGGDAPQAAEAIPDDGDAGEAVLDLERTDEYPLLALEGDSAEASMPQEDVDAAAAPQTASGTSEETAAAGLPADQPATGQHEGQHEGQQAETAGEAPEGDAGIEMSPAEDETLLLLIPDELRRAHAASAENAFEPTADSGPERRRWPWFLVAGVLLLALAAQAVHFWQDDLSRNPTVGPWLMRAYGALGLPLTPPVDLSAFELRQLGAASDGLQAGRIKLRASIVNRADFAQPYPLLRLSLQDRFGSTIGTRDLEPAEYLPGGATPASGLLGPAQRADAEVVFVDPGRDAVGFELDLCLREGGSVRCSDSDKASK